MGIWEWGGHRYGHLGMGREWVWGYPFDTPPHLLAEQKANFCLLSGTWQTIHQDWVSVLFLFLFLQQGHTRCLFAGCGSECAKLH